MSEYCENCECRVPPGCYHLHGEQKECKLGARIDAAWIVGMKIYHELNDRRGIDLDQIDDETMAEIVESLGKVAIDATKD